MSLFLNRSNTIPSCSPLTNGGRREGAGFTLIEVLVSVAILSIILAAIYSTFFLSYKAVMGMDEFMLKIQEARRAIDILKCELEAVYYSNDENTFLKIEDRDIHSKQATQISFTTFSILKPSLSRISYFIEEKDKKLNLLKGVESPYSDEITEGVEIIEDIKSFTVEAKYGNEWLKVWDTEINKSIPDEIRISISFEIKDRPIILFDIAKPRIGREV